MTDQCRAHPEDAERMRVVQQYIRRHLSEPLERTALARLAGFSVPHFHRVFAAHVGESPNAYIRRLRLERAGRKLRMGAIDIGEVALAAGYESHNAFSKAFKQQFGFSPSAFRALGCWAATQILNRSQASAD